MTRRLHPPPRIARQLQEAEALLSQGVTLVDVARALDVKYQTLYSRIKRYATRAATPAERLAELERENTFLRGALVALDIDPDLSLSAMIVRQRKRARPTTASGAAFLKKAE